MKKTNWYKWGVIGAILIAVFWLGCHCGGGKGFSCNRGDTLSHKKDTNVKEYVHDTTYVPTPYKVDSFIYLTKIKKVHDTLDVSGGTKIIRVPADTAAILKDYFTTVYYSDTIRPPQIRRGQAIITDTVTRNRIVGRRLQLRSTDTIFHDVITLQKSRAILYVGTSLTGNKNELFYGVGWDLSFKQKNDLMYGVGVRFLRGGQTMYEAGVRFPIKLGRKR